MYTIKQKYSRRNNDFAIASCVNDQFQVFQHIIWLTLNQLKEVNTFSELILTSMSIVKIFWCASNYYL